HHLGKAGKVGDIAHLQPGVCDRLCGPAGRDEFDSMRSERAREIDQPGFVRDGEEGASHGAKAFGHGASITTALTIIQGSWLWIPALAALGRNDRWISYSGSSGSSCSARCAGVFAS